MHDGEGRLWALAIGLGLLSLIAIGGINPVLPEIHRQVVEVRGWMSTERFTDLFAIAQGAPGPNILVVTLIGWDAAGLPGAAVATLAVCAPSCALAFLVGGLWHRFRNSCWRIAVQAGLVPVTVGLIGASSWLIARVADTTFTAFAITVVTAACVFSTRLHPILFLAAAAALGAAGFV
jgi:chromate transporter